MSGTYILRKATPADEPALRALHRAAFAGLAGAHYTAEQIDGFFAEVETVDPALIADGTYWLIEQGGLPVASGGWTVRPPGYAAPLPAPGTATIRAVFTDPGHARRGLARRIMDRIEEDAVVTGQADRIDLCATLSGLSLYLALGYRPLEARSLRLANGALFPAIAMTKLVWPPADTVGPVIPAFRASAA